MKKLSKRQIFTAMRYTALLRDKLLSDPLRPRYHFAAPGDYGLPSDPNMAFFANGRYHLMYLYKNFSDYYRLGHLSSRDLVHWRMHPDAVFPDELDGGIFSGGAFVEGNTVYIAYWALPREGGEGPDRFGGIRLARSMDAENHYEKWEKFPEYAVRATNEAGVSEISGEDGQTDYLGCADPSNLWKSGKTYYMQLGALVVLNKFRNNLAAPARMLGDWTELYSSEDLHSWTHLGRFYERDASDKWTDKSEDDMCPSFLPLPSTPDGGTFSGKYLQLFIAHNKGAQYYIGAYRSDQTPPFTIESHGRMSWKDNSFFAPEALVDNKGRQIMWAWLRDDRFEGDEEALSNGACGIFSLPRTLWYNEYGELGISPVEELRTLRYHETKELRVVNARSCEVLLRAETEGESRVGLRVFISKKEYVDVYYDVGSRQVVYDASNAQNGFDAKAIEQAPLVLRDGEKLRLDIFVDRCVIEVFANDRQSICRRSYPKNAPKFSLELIGERAGVIDLTAWDIDETNLF